MSTRIFGNSPKSTPKVQLASSFVGDAGGVQSMHANRPLESPISHSSTRWVAADVTGLLSASSFIVPFSRRSDPRAARSFEGIATPYCNGAELVLPLPGNTAADIPFFLDLWKRHSSINEIPGLELTDRFFDDLTFLYKGLICSFIEGDPVRNARWVAFQFTDEIVSSHVLRSDTNTILRSGPLARELIADGKLRRFQEAVVREGFDFPAEYEALVGTSEIPSFEHLCAAYLISVCVRRRSYALRLGGVEQKTDYLPHWIGAPVLHSALLPGELRARDPEPAIWFPWGSILRTVFDGQAPLTSRDPTRVREVLDAIRETCKVFQSEYASLPMCPVTDASVSRLTEREEFVVRSLLRFGIAPRYARTARTERLAEWLRALVPTNSICQRVIEQATVKLQPEWVRRCDVPLQIRYFRDTFWDVFDDPGIRRPSTPKHAED